jgi:hypothetical protein
LEVVVHGISPHRTDAILPQKIAQQIQLLVLRLKQNNLQYQGGRESDESIGHTHTFSINCGLFIPSKFSLVSSKSEKLELRRTNFLGSWLAALALLVVVLFEALPILGRFVSRRKPWSNKNGMFSAPISIH